MSNTDSSIYVGGLNRYIDEKLLQEKFERFGKIILVRIVNNRYGFIEFADERDSDDAIREMDDYKLEGSRIIVQKCRNDRKRRGSLTKTEDKCFK